MQLSFHKFNESQREQAVLKKLREGEIVAQISDAGTPGISDPGMALVSALCILLSFCLVFYLFGSGNKTTGCDPHPPLTWHASQVGGHLGLIYLINLFLLLVLHVKFCVMFFCDPINGPLG